METSWYYMDRAGKRQGPIRADDVATAWRGGQLAGDGLVWREGMEQWLPFEQVKGEFGVEGAPSAPPPPPPPPPEALPPMYAAPRSRVADASARGNANDDIVYAGFVRRWAALLIDRMILLVPLFITLVVAVALTAPAHGTQPGQPPPLLVLLFYPVYFLLALLYHALQESSAHQATLGKRMLGIKVTDGNGRRLEFGQAAGRWFAAALSYVTFDIGFLMAAFTERKRALHDMVADTLVVDRWAYTGHPERQQRGLSGCLIVFLIVAFGFIPILAILAAIAIPAYQDYVIRSQVSEAAVLAEESKYAVAHYYAGHGSWPADNSEAGLAQPDAIHGQYISSIAVTNGVITVTYGNKANRLIAGRILAFAPHAEPASVNWTCDSAAGTNLELRFRPAICRP